MLSASSWWPIQTSTTTAVQRWGLPTTLTHRGAPEQSSPFPLVHCPGSVGDATCPQVPGPLTQEMEAKKLEKKRAQKAQRKQREQAQREEQQCWEQEQERKQWFAALSDREKVRIGKGIQPRGGSADVGGAGHSSSQSCRG